ncbi:hypothetical protein LCGC14_2101920, partial [marine sediment metagenome]
TLFFHSKLSILGYERTKAGGAWGTYVNKNHFAGYVGMAALLGLGHLMGQSRSDRARSIRQYLSGFFKSARSTVTSLYLVAIAFMVLGVSFSSSRMGIAALLSSVALMAAMLAASRRKRTVMLLITALLAISILLSVFGIGHVKNRFQGVWDNALGKRLEIWESTIELSRDYPVIGSGLGTYSSVFQLYAPEGLSSLTRQAHNDYLELLAETGAAGVLIVYVALIYFIYLVSRNWLACSKKHGRHMAALGALSAVFYILVFSLTDFNLQIPANAYLFFISCALAYALLSDTPEAGLSGAAPPATRWKTRASAIMLLCALVPLMALSALQWRAESTFPAERSFIRADDPPRITSPAEEGKAKRAASYLPGNDAYHTLLGQYYFNESKNPDSGNEKRLELISKAIEQYSLALGMSPASINTLGLLARAEFSKGDFLGATRRLDTALDIAPTNYSSHLSYAIAVTNFIEAFPEGMRRTYLRKASQEFQIGINMNPGFKRSSAVLVNMANAFLMLGDSQKALKHYDLISRYEPWVLPHIVKSARIHLDSGRYEEGRKRYNRLYRFNYKDRESRLKIADFLAEDVSSRPEAPELRDLLIKQLMHLKEWSRAASALSADLGKGRRPDEDIYFEMGNAYESAGETERAKEMYINVLSLDKKHRKASMRLVSLLKKE